MDILDSLYPKQQMKTYNYSSMRQDESVFQSIFSGMSESNIGFVIEEAVKASCNDANLPTLQEFLRLLEDDASDLGSLQTDYSSDSTVSRDESDIEPSSPTTSTQVHSSIAEQATCISSEEISGFATKKRKDKRNRRKPIETKTLLAQCLLQWLEDPRYNPAAITWLSKQDGLFQITKSATISALWGRRKGNKKEMNHEKLSRALRHYYKDGTLERMKNKKKLCYKFSSQAMQKFSAFFST